MKLSMPVLSLILVLDQQKTFQAAYQYIFEAILPRTWKSLFHDDYFQLDFALLTISII